MKRIKCLFGLLIAPLIVIAQQDVNYDDVAIVVNDNSQVSIDTGTYEVGQLIQIEPMAINNPFLSINLSNHKDGIYFIRIETDKGSINKKVLIAR